MPKPTFGGYTNVTAVIGAAGQTALQAQIDLFVALIPNPAVAMSSPSPVFDGMHPNTADQLRTELAALKAAIAAAPAV